METSKKGLVALVATLVVFGLVVGCSQGANGKSNTTSVDPFAGTTWEYVYQKHYTYGPTITNRYKLRFRNDKTVEYIYLPNGGTARSTIHEYKSKTLRNAETKEITRYEARIINPTLYTEYFSLDIKNLNDTEGEMWTPNSSDDECKQASGIWRRVK